MSALREELGAFIERAALDLVDPDRIEAIAEDMRIVERQRVHHVGLVVAAVVLSAMQPSTDTEGRWLDAQRKYEDLGGAESGKTSFRDTVIKMVPVMRKLLRRRMQAFAASTDQPELQGRLRAFADVLIPDGCAFKLAAALSGAYAGTSQPAELKLHAVYSVRAGGVVSATKTAGSVHDSDGFWPTQWVRDALYIWDLGYVSHERFVDAATAGAHVLQRLKSTQNPVVLASYGPTGTRHDVHHDGAHVRLEMACQLGLLPRARILDLDVEITDDQHRTVVARVVCVPFGGEDRYYLTTLPRAIFSPHDVAEMYRIRWEIELFFRNWKGALRLDQVRRLQRPLSLEAAITASLLAGILAQQITSAVNDLERLAHAEAFSPCAASGGVFANGA
ncbi:MAG: IS4 family transposase [Polyangiales bacterium]